MGIRWLIGIPAGYITFQLIMRVNVALLEFLTSILTFIPEVIWQIEAFIVNSMVAVYFGMVAAYFILPRDHFAIFNNKKVKALYWAASLWTCIQFLLLGVAIYDATHGSSEAIVSRILYPIVMTIMIWITYKGIELVDYKHNQPVRDYLDRASEEQRININ